MEMIRGLFEPDPVWLQQGRNHRRLQQPQLISMLTRMLVGLPSLTDGNAAGLVREASDAGGAGKGMGVLETLICRIDSMSECESCQALQVSLLMRVYGVVAHRSLERSPTCESPHSLELSLTCLSLLYMPLPVS